MFSISLPLASQFHSQPFSASISPFHHNVHIFGSTMTSSSISDSKPSIASHQAPRWKHAPKPPQLLQSSSERRGTRNTSILRGINDRRQNKRDQTRQDHILRSDMLAEQRAWEQAQEVEAARWTACEEDEMHTQPDAELEDLLRREEEELQARIDEAMQTEAVGQGGGEFGMETDDDFDMLVLEAVEKFERSQHDGQRDMDLS